MSCVWGGAFTLPCARSISAPRWCESDSLQGRVVVGGAHGLWGNTGLVGYFMVYCYQNTRPSVHFAFSKVHRYGG